MGYGFSALLASGSLAEVEQTLLLRALLSPAGHVAWTGLTVARPVVGSYVTAQGAGDPRVVSSWPRCCCTPPGTGSNSVWVHVVVGGLSLLALLLTIRWAHRDPTAPRRGRT